MTVYIENSREVHQKIKHRIIVRSSNSTSVYVLQELKANIKHLYTNENTSIFTITTTWKQLKYPLTNELIKQSSMYIQWNIMQP